uniref:Uncharacterized protein n=1 Tax=uncultured Desulfobacterium sp. TaxID=201089 RepID=E1YH11_9BACT|nr:unknown protein [uncultured Desulfobacterium sp.]
MHYEIFINNTLLYWTFYQGVLIFQAYPVDIINQFYNKRGECHKNN